MISNALKNMVESAVCTEHADIKHIHGERYASAHEGYGVLMEELHEATVELRDLDSLVREQLMEDLHDNDLSGMICSLTDVELFARKLAYEAIQVAAVARKMADTLAEIREEAEGA
ncbi:MAG: hypothetical protein IJ438_09955 [Clostridia bacterium]|nr:hypothetical protein [Clostridia bacterium]